MYVFVEYVLLFLYANRLFIIHADHLAELSYPLFTLLRFQIFGLFPNGSIKCKQIRWGIFFREA
jgi:hypothetical protein